MSTDANKNAHEVYVNIAKTTGVFKPCELEVVTELVEDTRNNKDSSYVVFDEKIGNETIGFIIFGRTPMTDFCWDIYWIVVDKKYHGKGIGKKLLSRVEEYVLTQGEKAAIRLETSSKTEYQATQMFYRKNGYKEVGNLPNFYAAGDSLVIFYKEI